MKYVFQVEQMEEIKQARRRNRDKQIERRLKVLELRSEGMGLEAIAERVGFHRSYVSSIIKKYFEEGLAAVAEKHDKGNRRNMSVEKESALLEQYQEKGEQGQLVEIEAIETAYEKEVGHRIGSGQIYRVLHRHGWRKVMPRSRHPQKAREEEIESSKKLTKK